jgi:hypothetical protein
MAEIMKWIPLASVFPATLNSETDVTRLPDGQTPEAWGLDIDHPGYLATGTAPSGTDRIKKTYTVGGSTYNWYYNRLWLASGATLLYGYPEYQTVFLPHNVALGFSEDSQDVVTFLPFLGTAMLVCKSTGAYSIANAANPGGGFTHSEINPALGIATAAQATEFDGIAYISNANGLFAWDSQGIVEISAAFRSLYSRFASATLYRDETKRRIVGQLSGSTVFAYEPSTKRFYDYSQTGFRFTTRALNTRTQQQPVERPFSVSKIGFFYNNTTQDTASLLIQVRRDVDWEDSETITVPYDDTARTWMEFPLSTNYAARSFQMRIIDMTSGLRIRDVAVLTDYPTQSETSWSQ